MMHAFWANAAQARWSRGDKDAFMQGTWVSRLVSARSLIDTLPPRIAHKDKPQSSCLSLVYTMNDSPIAVRYRPR